MRFSRGVNIPIIRRWLRFNAVGAMGICVQIAAAYLFGSIANVDPLWATALAVEAAVLHNFVWHEHFTWPDRHAGTQGWILLRLLAFNLTTGAVSIAGNVILVSLSMRELGAPLLAANLVSIAACSLLNFFINDKVVFRGSSPSPLTSQ